MSDCPKCGDEKAEIGLSRVYCPNKDCANFDEAQLDKVVAKAEEEYQDYENLVYGWVQLSLFDDIA